STLPALAMAARQDKGHGGKAWGVTVEGFPEGGAQFRRPIVIEQAEKLHGEPSGGFTALEGGLKKGRAFRDQDGQATGGGGAESLAFLLPQGLVVSRLFDEFMPVIGAGMGSDFGGAIEQAHAGGGSHQGQNAAQGLGRHGIVVEVEADPEGF